MVKQHYRWRSAAVAFAIVAMATEARAEILRSKDDFLELYGPAATNIERVYGSLRIGATVTKPSGTNRLNAAPTSVQYDATDSKLCVQVSRLLKAGKENRKLIVINHDRAFCLNKPPETSCYIVDAADIEHNEAMKIARLSCPVAFSPFCILNVRVSDLIRLENLRFLRAENVLKPGHRSLNVTFDWQFVSAQGQNKRMDLTISLLPEASWALSAYKFGKDGSWKGGDVLYEGYYDRVPLVSRLELWSEEAGIRKKQSVAEVRECKPALPSHINARFEMKDYGLPEIGSGSDPSFTKVACGTIAGIVFLALSGFMRRVSKPF